MADEERKYQVMAIPAGSPDRVSQVSALPFKTIEGAKELADAVQPEIGDTHNGVWIQKKGEPATKSGV